MRYAVTFYSQDQHEGEAIVCVHEVSCAQLDAYTITPDTTLAAIRLAEPTRRIDGFRVTDENGRLVMHHFQDDGDD